MTFLAGLKMRIRVRATKVPLQAKETMDISSFEPVLVSAKARAKVKVQMLDDEDVSSLSHRQICQAVLAKNDRQRTLTILRQPAPADEANPIALETSATEVKDVEGEPANAPTDLLLF